jgi:lysophospholipase L1-like esterase
VRPDPASQFFAGNPFLSIYSVGYFVRDKHLGHRFFGGALVGSKHFCGLQSLVSAIRREPRRVVLCLGDSSMSGWNSDNVTLQGVCSESVFFTYPTFPDYLRKMYGCHVINAGVPGFSSLQGLRYGCELLAYLSDASVKVDFVVIFFGNNDATFSSLGDAERLRGGERPNKEKMRVPVLEYGDNVEGLVRMCDRHGASPVVIVPPRNLGWAPGVRCKRFPQEMHEAFAKLNDSGARRSLAEARERFGRGEWDMAAELDIVLPRIKERYVNSLVELARAYKVRLIKIPDRELTTDSFLDYCHPAPILNQRLAMEIGQHCSLTRTSYSKRVSEPHCRVLNGVMSVRLRYIGVRLAACRKWNHLQTKTDTEPSVYPFY